MYVGLIVLGTLSLSSCGGENKSEDSAATDTTTLAPSEETAPVDTAASTDTTGMAAPADSAK